MTSMLQKLTSRPRPIRVGLAGAGTFGEEMVTQISAIKNMEVTAIGDLDARAGVAAFLKAGCRESDIEICASRNAAQNALERGKRVVVEDALLLNTLDVEVVCDVTGSPTFGAEFAHNAITNGKHVVVVNIESDVVVGSVLRRMAERAGVVYTEADGDQPSLIAGMVDWARVLGLEVTAAGKWTHGVSREDKWLAHGKRSDIGYSDGSKNQVEMGCVANMTGLPPDTRGLRLPSLPLTEIANAFTTRGEGGIFERKGVVDAIACVAPDGRVVEPLLGGGVFVVVETDNPCCRDVIRHKGFLHSADGRRALLYRPFHFVGIEAPMSILRAVLYREATGAPLPQPVADVMAIAKCDLPAGTLLDGIGGMAVRGVVERADIARAENALPLGLAENVTLNRPVPRGTLLTYAMLEKPGDSLIWKLRRQQDADRAAF